MLPDFERPDRIGEFWGYPQSRAFAELLIDCEENRVLRAVLVWTHRALRFRCVPRLLLLPLKGSRSFRHAGLVQDHVTSCFRYPEIECT
jgi:hypothetical protein